MEKKIKTVKDLRDDLIAVYESLRSNSILLNEAKEINNTAGKILQSAKVQLQYNELMENRRGIEFLETEQ